MSNDSNHFSDKDTVAKILNGNIQEFAVVVNHTEKLVGQIVCKLTNNEDDQKDLVQDIYLKAYQKLGSFQFNSKLSTWIATIAYNTTINYLRKKKIPISGIDLPIEDIFIVTENPELETIKRESLEILNAEISKLPPLYQTLIALYHLEELSNKEISVITKLPEGTIKSYLSRARKSLRETINHHYNNAEL